MTSLRVLLSFFASKVTNAWWNQDIDRRQLTDIRGQLRFVHGSSLYFGWISLGLSVVAALLLLFGSSEINSNAGVSHYASTANTSLQKHHFPQSNGFQAGSG